MIFTFSAEQPAGGDKNEGQCFRNGQGQPDSWGACNARHQEECGNEEDKSSCKRVDGCRDNPLNALIVADYGNIDNVENESCRHKRHSGGGDAVAVRVGAEKQRGNVFYSEGERGREEDSGADCGDQCHFAGFHYPAPFACAVVVADDRLGGLRNGIAGHEDEGHNVARDRKRGHAILAQVSHKHVVANE